MKDVKTIATGKNYTAADFGKFNELSEYVLDMGTVKIPGKIFGGQAVNADGGQFSFQKLPITICVSLASPMAKTRT